MTVAAPSYIRKHGRPETPADLIDHACIQMRNSLTGEPMNGIQIRPEDCPAKTSGRLLLNDAGTLLGACLAGAGIARLKASGVQDLIDKGRLVQLLPEWTGEAFALYALYPSRHLPAAKVRAFIDFVIEILAADSYAGSLQRFPVESRNTRTASTSDLAL